MARPRLPRTAGTACEVFDLLAVEVSLGTASCAEQAAALAHTRGCPRCRVELDALSGLAQALTALLPDAAPPAGFAQRVVSATAPATGRTRSGRRLAETALGPRP